jgi:hAT family C-terminal dimerisation region
MERYLNDQVTQDTVSTGTRDILDIWRTIESQYPTVARMAKDILAIPLAGVGMERVFNLGRDTCTYRRGHLHGTTIQKVMLTKHAHHNEMIDEILLSEAELKKESMEGTESDTGYVASEEEKLAQSCCFDFRKNKDTKATRLGLKNRRGRGRT